MEILERQIKGIDTQVEALNNTKIQLTKEQLDLLEKEQEALRKVLQEQKTLEAHKYHVICKITLLLYISYRQH